MNTILEPVDYCNFEQIWLDPFLLELPDRCGHKYKCASGHWSVQHSARTSGWGLGGDVTLRYPGLQICPTWSSKLALPRQAYY